MHLYMADYVAKYRAMYDFIVAVLGLIHQNLLVRYSKRNSTFRRYKLSEGYLSIGYENHFKFSR